MKMQVLVNDVTRRLKPGRWFVMMAVMVMSVAEVMSLNGPNVCVVEQKYNVTKRVKYRAPMAVRTYEWCFAMPPRCSKWTTEMKDLTRLENEERTAEVAVCCPGYKMRDISCVPVCPLGKTGHGCSMDCPPNKWGPNCVHTCKKCSDQGKCSPVTGECQCQDGWQGERCEISMLMATSLTTATESLLTATKTAPPLTFPTTEAATQKITPKSTTTVAPITTVKTSVLVSSTVTQKSTELLSSASTAISKTTNMLTETEMSSTRLEKPKTLYNNSSIITWPVMTNVFKETTIPYTLAEIASHTTKSPMLSSLTTTTEAQTTIRTKETPNTKKPTTSTTLVNAGKFIETLPTSTNKIETTRKPESTVKILPTTVKFKPKEIWIKPAQKGESTIVETKIKPSHEKSLLRYTKNTTMKELSSTATTPRTIIVSIIPTSMSYSTFKKLSLTTASSLSTQHYRNLEQRETVVFQNITTGRSNVTTSTPMHFTIRTMNAVTSRKKSTDNHLILPNVTIQSRTTQKTIATTRAPSVETTKSVFTLSNTTNSMSGMKEVNRTNSFSYNFFTTTPPLSSTKVSPKKSISAKNSAFTNTIVTPPLTKKPNYSLEATTIKIETTSAQESAVKHNVTVEKSKTATKTNKIVDVVKDFITNHSPSIREQNVSDGIQTSITQKPINVPSTAKPVISNVKTNDLELTSSTNTVTTETVEGEGSFNILTEPEHITAIIDDKSSKSSSLDLISVISIAGGVMMSVITVAVIIVMIERCRRPGYGEVRKVNDIRMKVVMGNDDEPPPYVRSIFHAPLPALPITEKCHYQPISTLDRNLKQFMRPVVVQTISPLMLENFRGILECHYDHLPAQRAHNFRASCCSGHPRATSMETCTELLRPCSPSVSDSTIDALKCEAQLDVIDSTTSEPLYAEIPCWRPPSEHAVEIVNMNGEAVTEL